MIRLNAFTPDNWRFDLHVREDQRTFVAPTAVILARAWAYRDARSRAFLICSDETPVGAALYYDDDEISCYEFSQLFIDERYQGRGYGTEAARQILHLMEQDGKYDKVELCYIQGNDAARELYEKLGFVHTGEVEENEVVMEKRLR